MTVSPSTSTLKRSMFVQDILLFNYTKVSGKNADINNRKGNPRSHHAAYNCSQREKQFNLQYKLGVY